MEKDKIEVGEYIRTKIGDIGEVENINNYRPSESKICVDMKLQDLVFISEDIIIKHSKNIIDLIEVGDYVNGCKVLKIEKEKGHITVGQEVKGVVDYNYIFDNEIETIVTKEQFKEMEYRV